MNHFYNTSGKTYDWRRFVYQNNSEKNDGVDYGNDVLFKAESFLTMTKEEMSEIKNDKDARVIENLREGKDCQEQIDLVCDTFKDGNEQDKELVAKLLKDIPASEFLARKSSEELKTLFLEEKGKNKFEVNFHENETVQRYIGAGDLLPFSEKFIKINTVIAKRSIYEGVKVGYLSTGASYLPIYGGEEIEIGVIPSEKDLKAFEVAEVLDFTSDEEEETKDDFKEKVKADEKALEEMKEAMREAVNKLREEHGLPTLSLEEIKEMSPEKLFKEVGTLLAKQVEAKYGVPWKVCLAQAALESGHGKKALGNNFFGIKAMGKYAGKSQEFLTTEYFDKNKTKATKMFDKFRRYDSIAESFSDYGQFLKNSPYYGGIIKTNKESGMRDLPAVVLSKIIKAGYATDPQYVEKAEGALNTLGYSLYN